MNMPRYILGSVAVFVFIYLTEFLLHGVLMKGSYDQHLALLRPEAEAGSHMPFMALGFLILAFGFCFIFTKGYENKGLVEGLRYGFYVGVTFGISSNLINFAVFPWPSSWIIAWSIGFTVILMLAGALFAAIYKPRAA
jgi:hypothetical protein